jgi:hypothetical protein
MGIFSRLFRGGQDGPPTEPGDNDATDDAASIDTARVEAPPTEEQPSPRMVETPVLMASAAGVGVPPLAAPLWTWPQRAHEQPTEPPTPRQETPVTTPPDDPAPRPSPPKRAPLPGVAKSTAPAPSPAPAAPSAPVPKTSATEPKAPVRKPDNDATTIMSPPPPPPSRSPLPRLPTPASGLPIVTFSVAAAAKAPAPTTSERARRTKADSVGAAFDRAVEPSQVSSTEPEGVSTPADLAAVRGLFHEVAVAHVAQVRDVMLELRYGDADPAWIESTKPALRSLHAMAGQMELPELCVALDEFCAVVDAAVANRARIGDEDKAELLRRYQRLVELIPQAFELDAERDRREPIIVESLLYQIDGVEKPTIDKLFAVGLSRLDALMNANADDVVAVSGVRRELADAIVQQFRSYRANAQAAVSSRDPAAERRELGDLLIVLSLQNDDFVRVSESWTDDAQARKRQLRKDREQTYQKIKIALARLGERDQLAHLEKQPFKERIASLDKYLSAPPPARPQ